MDLSGARRPARHGPLTPAERARRAAQGLCMYCGGPGHFAAECPARPVARPARVAATSEVGVPPVMSGAGAPPVINHTSRPSPSSSFSAFGFPFDSSSGSGSLGLGSSGAMSAAAPAQSGFHEDLS